MAEISKLGRDSAVSLSCELGFGASKTASKMASPDHQVVVKTTEGGDSFVLDMESLSSHVVGKDFNSLQRSLSRKGSQRGDRKLHQRETDDSPTKGALGGGVCTAEKVVVIPVGGTTGSEPVTNMESNRSRRYCNRRSSWIDPKRVLLLFATLSSMGTIILIYFTLSMGKINGDNAVAAQQ
ncbi:hypothetical protein H6P81_007077 [Aristolochia fimbriata]|uniref:Transmembrane protein n=1 Tax=Aristolochia fimbriata TaxID=158543 RepID=A0AAV7F3N0_ARIFI|nr:hypothetical protein H6P81_007077 [Aristolochia fimbriata]